MLKNIKININNKNICSTFITIILNKLAYFMFSILLSIINTEKILISSHLYTYLLIKYD